MKVLCLHHLDSFWKDTILQLIIWLEVNINMCRKRHKYSSADMWARERKMQSREARRLQHQDSGLLDYFSDQYSENLIR